MYIINVLLAKVATFFVPLKMPAIANPTYYVKRKFFLSVCECVRFNSSEIAGRKNMKFGTTDHQSRLRVKM